MEQASKISISLCMILKNERQTIKRCLNSVYDFCSEFILGIDEADEQDTEIEIMVFLDEKKFVFHSEEQGKKKFILSEYGTVRKSVILYRYKWENSFSKARNQGMELANGDYILIMDGHEYIPDRWYNITESRMLPIKDALGEVIKIINTDRDKIDEVHFHLYMQPFHGQTPNNYFLQPRIYKNAPEIKYNRDAHNVIKGVDQSKVIHCPEVIIIHDAPPDNRNNRLEQRLDMNIDRLKREVQKNPDDTRARFYLGNTYIEGKEWEKAIHQFDEYIRRTGRENSEKYQACIHKAICHMRLKEYIKARDTLHIAIGIDPFRRDAYLILGDMAVEVKDYERAIYYYNACLKINPQPSRMFSNGPANTWDPHQKLAFAYAHQNQINKAVSHLKTAYSYFPNEKWAEQIKMWADRKANIYVIDAVGSFTKPIIRHLEKKHNVIAMKRYDGRMANWADAIFCEWGGEEAFICSRAYPKKTVIRIHGYEAYGPQQPIDFNACKKTIFVANHIKELYKRISSINDDKQTVIFNGVDIDKFYIRNEDRKPVNIGYAGLINVKKNPFLLCEIIQENPEINFHLRLTHQDPFWKEEWDRRMKNQTNVFYYGWFNDLSEFWNKMSGVLSTSIVESFSYNVAEAMACGCIPYIFNWYGADEIYPTEYIYTKRPKFKKDVKLEERQKVRQFILDKYPERTMLEKIEAEIMAGTGLNG